MTDAVPRYLVIRHRYGKPQFCIEYGEHRCHVDGREPPTTQRVAIPPDWHGSLGDVIRHYEAWRAART